MYGVDKITVTEDASLITFSKIPADLRLISEIFLRFGEGRGEVDALAGHFRKDIVARVPDVLRHFVVEKSLTHFQNGIVF